MMLLYVVLFGLATPQTAVSEEVPAAQHAVDEQLLAYGDDPLQQMLFWEATGENAPLIVFVHGGGWTRGDMRSGLTDQTRENWQAQGYAVASLNYRLVPDARVEDQATDIASALALLIDQSAELGVDPERIVLVGHSAGAHLAALVATDPQYLAAHSLPVESLRGIVVLDGAGYDVPAQVSSAGPRMRDLYGTVFGEEAERQAALSPVSHAGVPNAQSFLILHVQRRASRAQSIGFAEVLASAGTPAQVERVAGRGMRGHMEINRRLGEADYPATAIVDAWLAGVMR